MMFERFTPDARTVVVHAQEHARRLGHRYIGCEHLLLAVASTGRPASAVLREHGVTPERVEEEIVRRVGLGGGAELFGDLDRDALSAIGIDLDAVRARIEASFGAEALNQAANAMHGRPRPSRLNPRRAIPPGLLRRWRRRRRPAPAAFAPTSTATGRYQAAGAVPRGHLPFTTPAKKSLENSVREAQAMHDQYIGVEHIALALIGTNNPILLALGASGPALRAAILDRYRQAS
ncbi:Clp protease N-terminal domain-containing protein [Amycolatopsis acidiphila]|uniref:Clp protease n=1 Tax=Amycolatopsis acidiphila TaxID=715473 RepID=A0A558AEM3_9PSEU|nr:Clp protease [Amycolatopsis acidiphila]GHG80640.1 ATPase [Amycolatopsis acidiphila]